MATAWWAEGVNPGLTGAAMEPRRRQPAGDTADWHQTAESTWGPQLSGCVATRDCVKFWPQNNKITSRTWESLSSTNPGKVVQGKCDKVHSTCGGKRGGNDNYSFLQPTDGNKIFSNWWKIMGKCTQYFKADTDKLQWLPPRAWGLMLFLRWPLMVHRLGTHSLVFSFLVRYRPQKTRVITLYVHLLKGFSNKTTKRPWLHSLRKCFQACWLD